MKNSLIALAAAALLAPALLVLPVRAQGTGKSAEELMYWLGLGPIAADSGSTAKSASRAAYAASVRRQRAQKAEAKQAVQAAERGRVAASAQIVKTPPISKSKAGAKVEAVTSALSSSSREARPSLDCRQYIPTAGMTISVACAD